MLNGCTKMDANTQMTLPLCYSPDPMDGLSFIWQRDLQCRPAPRNRVVDAEAKASDCRSGVYVTNTIYSVNKTIEGNFNYQNISLFRGLNLFTVSNITTYYNGPITQISSVQTSEEALIDVTMPCCIFLKDRVNATLCDVNGSQNDGYGSIGQPGGGSIIVSRPGRLYMTKIKQFPTYQLVTVKDGLNILQATVTAAGSFWSVLFSVGGIICAAYKFLISSKRAAVKDASAL
jgi:hypothetical protein